MELIEKLNWRYATKQFDPERKVSTENLELIKEAIRLSPSSYGLQPYRVLIIEDQSILDQLPEHSWGQRQVADASHVFVFCNRVHVSDDHIDQYVQLKASTQGVELEQLKGYGDFMKTKIAEKSPKEQGAWTARQTYIALGNLMTACAMLNIDACPMEGIVPAQYDEILGLSSMGLTTAVVAPIGYRGSGDKTQHAPKVRLSAETLFTHL